MLIEQLAEAGRCLTSKGLGGYGVCGMGNGVWDVGGMGCRIWNSIQLGLIEEHN